MRNAYVISLYENQHKFLRSKNQLVKYFDNVLCFNAVDTRKLGNLPKRVLCPGAIGCLRSHRDLMITFLNDLEGDYLYVFEDDIIVHEGFTPDHEDCDILYYGASQIAWYDDMKGPVYKAKQTLGTFAMRIHKRIIPKILTALETTDTTLDNTIAEHIQPIADCRVIFPHTVTADVTSSDIRRRINPTEWERKCRWPRPKKRSFLENVTFGIVSFNRFEHLEKAVASLPPECKFLVADNSTIGRPSVPHLALEPDAGASACRNALMAHCETDYLMLLDDDTYLQDSVEPLFDFLEREPSYSCIGGGLRLPNGSVMHSGVRLENNELSGAGWQVTDELIWKPCDMVFDFCLLRKDCGRWDNNIKIGGEHRKFFEHIQGRVAYTPMVKAYHDITGRTPEYMAFRNRSTEPPVLWDSAVYKHHVSRSNILVFGVGHSGTTILTQMLMGLGWKNPRADKEFAEDTVIREYNQHEQYGRDPTAALLGLPQPWVIKDPRFVVTLEHWYEAFVKFDVTMVYITKDNIEESYIKRGERLDQSHGGYSVKELIELAERKFDAWPWTKIRVRYEDLKEALTLWKPR